MTLTHQRLFGRTKLDAFDFPYSGWYMITSGVETKITATATQLNSLALLPLAAATFAPAADYFLFKDATDSAGKYQLWTDVATAICGTTADTGLTHASGVLKVAPADAAHAINSDSFVYMTAAGLPKKDLMTDVIGSMVGTAATTGLTHTNGVMSVAPADNALAPAADSLVYMTAAGLPKKDTVVDVVASITGEGLAALAAGTINLYDEGQTSHGGVFFTGVGDCTSVTVGAVTYTRDDTPDVTQGEWASGAGAAAAATNLAAAINGDTRAALVYTAEAIGAGVVIRAINPGAAGNVAVARVGGTEPSATQNLVEGITGHTCQIGAVYHTVTLFDLMLTDFTLELPFAPNVFVAQVRDSTGAVRGDVTDTFNFDTAPLGIVVAQAGATHLVAGDVITVISISL